MAGTGSWPGLLGRRRECDQLSSLVAAAKAGRSQVLMLRGEAGIGKTALLDFLLERAAGCRVARAAGVESEMELAFAGLHQLCGPYLDRLEKLPSPQGQALATTFGLRPGHSPDHLLVGLAVLTLLSEVAEERPLVCVVDDAQWLDDASVQTMEFVARRLAAEPVAMVFAARQSDEEPALAGLPELAVRGLGNRDAAALLDSAMAGPLDPRVRDRILAESQGNPLALLELPRGQPSAELAFGATGAAVTPLAHRLEQGFLRRLGPLPRQSRQLLLTAAAEPVGDVPLLWRAVERMGIATDAATAVEAGGWIELRDLVRFRHPLVRSAVYRSASPAERREVHQALADVTDPAVDPDRRAWHRARAAVGPDEAVAAELERSAGRAVSRGGIAAAAAFLETAAALTPDPARRAGRSLEAGQAKATSGAFEDALALLSVAQGGPLDEIGRARIDLLRAQISYNSSHGNEALPLFLAAARRLEPLDARLARETYLEALCAARFAGRLAAGDGMRHGIRQVAAAAQEARASEEPTKADLLLNGMAVLYTAGYRAAAPLLHRAVDAYGSEDLTLEEALRGAWLAAAAAVDLWDDVHWDVLTRRHLDAVRAAGALSVMPLALNSRVMFDLFSGDLTEAASLVRECRWIAEVTSGENTLTPIGEVCLAALRGGPGHAEPLIQVGLDDAVVQGQGVAVTMMHWARAVLCNGLAHYDAALEAARQATAEPQLGATKLALPEVVEAAVYSGQTGVAATALEQLSEMARASGTEYALAVEAGSRALLSRGGTAEELYREAIERLARTRISVGSARARLRYGEWLRREGRRVDARTELRTAHEALTALGIQGFAERARRELLATGETVRKRSVETYGELTSQEAHIARLAAEGLTNPEIAAALYISPRTVEWHLRKIFSKLGVGTRRQLRRSLADAALRAASA
ncbi:MAG: helix-turn-helix transcriptional regulator [Kineosporiaceae bacterium]